MKIQRNAAWVADQEAAAREMRLANIKLQIRAGAYETPARILGTVQKLKEVLMPKHTPEPWVVTRKETADYYPEFYVSTQDVRGPDRGYSLDLAPRHICKVFVQGLDEDMANLALLQAAPKLLAALRSVCLVLESAHQSNPEGLWLGCEYEDAKAAIEAAEREIQCR